jgi:TfoX/Sxy family transcriptional regulator of competence genes
MLKPTCQKQEKQMAHAELEDQLGKMLLPLGAESKRMFGGLCFMLNGNMVVGTFRNGLLVRVGKQAHAQALAQPGAETFTMNGKAMEGYFEVAAAHAANSAVLQGWVKLALAFNKTLPAKPSKKN